MTLFCYVVYTTFDNLVHVIVDMISEEQRAAIAKYNQSHILKYYDEGKLSEEEKIAFEKQVLLKLSK